MKILLYSFVIFFLSQNSNAEQNNLEFNKKLVVEFFKEIIIDRKSKDIDKYIGDKYIEHVPYLTSIDSGKEKLRALVNSFPPRAKNEPRGKIVRVIAEKDLVVLHIMTPKFAAVDIFRVENSKIVEHWDVVQATPEESVNK